MSAPPVTMQEFRRTPTDRRIDPDTQRQVIELAARLQERERDHLSEADLEEMAVEAGLSREYVREAIRQINQPQATPVAKPKERPAAKPMDALWFYVVAITTLVVYASVSGLNRPNGASITLFFIGLGLAAIIGFFAPRRWPAAILGFITGGMAMQLNANRTEFPEFMASCGTAVLLALAAQWIREKVWPVAEVAAAPAPQTESAEDRLDRLERLRSLRAELESERVRRAFLSVDVVGSVGIKQSLGELEAERLFGMYQRWIRDIVANHGGEIQSAAGDGAMAIFPNGTSALRAARAIQSGISGFNQSHDGQLALRCGISEGPVAWRPGTPIGAIQSPVLDRAALRQRSAVPGSIAVGEELVAEAAVEYGRIEARVDSHGERVFIGTP